jgi:hypothetical protein
MAKNDRLSKVVRLNEWFCGEEPETPPPPPPTWFPGVGSIQVIGQKRDQAIGDTDKEDSPTQPQESTD